MVAQFYLLFNAFDHPHFGSERIYFSGYGASGRYEDYSDYFSSLDDD